MRWALLVLSLSGCSRGNLSSSPDVRRVVPTVRRALEVPDAGFRAQPPTPSLPTMFRLDARHTGRSGWSLPRAPVARLLYRTEGRISSQPSSLPGGSVVVGSHDGVVYAIEPTSGRIAWRVNTGDRVYSSPLVLGERVYVGTDADRMLALSRWGSLAVGLATDDDADTSAVAAHDGTLRFASGRALFAVDLELSVRWRLELGGKIFSSPAVLEDGTIVVGSQDDAVYAIAPDGQIRWRFATGNDVDATPAVDERGVVYIGSDDGFVYALSVRDGSLRWRTSVGGFVRVGAALGLDGAVVLGTFGPRPRIVALDRDTGQQRWSVGISGPGTRDYGCASSALVARDGRYAVGIPGGAVLFLSEDGAVEHRIALPADVDSSPVLIADGKLVVGCDDGGLYLLEDPRDR